MEILSTTTREEHTNNEHLNLLSIFYFVFGGLSLLVAFILLIYVLILGFIFSNNTIRESMESQPDGEVVGYVFGVVSIVFLVLFVFILIIGVLQIMAGFKIRQKRNRIFNMVIGVLALPSFPLGTALGIFTIIVLSRPSVIEMFNDEKERLLNEKYGKTIE